MLQAVATFGAGVLAGQGLGACRGALPSCALQGRGGDAGAAFKLAVHVHGAAAAELGDPGVVSRPQPRLEVLLGQTRKRTEVADFAGDGEATASSSSSQGPRDAAAELSQDVLDCPWRFGDTLTFAAQLGDVLGAGLRLQLSAHSDVCLGPLRVQLPRAQELGEATLDLRRRVLPACERRSWSGGHFGGSGRPEWRTPVLLVPLTRANVEDRGSDQLRVVARVVVSVSVNTNPEALLRKVEELEKPLVDRVVDPVVRCMQTPVGGCIEEPDTWLASCSGCRPHAEAGSPAQLQALPKAGSPEPVPPGAGAGYATCEVPPSLAVGGPVGQGEPEDEPQPALGGLWPPPPSSHRRGSPRRGSEGSATEAPRGRSAAPPALGARTEAPAPPPAGWGPAPADFRGGEGKRLFFGSPERRFPGPPALVLSPGVASPGVPCAWQDPWGRVPNIGVPFNAPPGVHQLGSGVRVREVAPPPWGLGQPGAIPRTVQYA